MPEWLGQTIGNVRIDKYLARGGMAEVYLGTHLTLERPVAIKVLHSFIEEEPDLLLRFQREARVVAGLRHPNIVQIYDFDTVNGHPYIVMEYLKGPSLAVYLRDLHNRNGRVERNQVARLLKSLTSSLDYAHDHDVIHRDIKPGNILLHGKADEIPTDKPLTNDVVAIITDFGLVRIANTASISTSGMVSGTPKYMSPEQARGDPVDRRTDIYSLGIVLYEMLAGTVPFEADTTLSVIYKQINDPPPAIPGISPEVQKVIDKALAKKADERYSTAGEMASEYFQASGMISDSETLINGFPESKPKQTRTLGKQKPANRKPLWIGLGIALLVGVIGLAISALGLFSDTTNGESPSASGSPEKTAAVGEPVLPSPEGMIQIETGTYEVGSSTIDDYHSESVSILLNGFWIDQFQTTYDEYQNFLDETGTQAPARLTGEGRHPVRGVDWDQAVAYCSWLNKRLPTEAEWEAAGRGGGSDPQMYPWGDDPSADGNTIDLPDQDTYEVGALSFNKSPFGLYDMVGNIWEWVGDPYAEIPAGMKILRGGRFGLPILDLAYRVPVTPDDERYLQYAGFRCAADQVR